MLNNKIPLPYKATEQRVAGDTKVFFKQTQKRHNQTKLYGHTPLHDTA